MSQRALAPMPSIVDEAAGFATMVKMAEYLKQSQFLPGHIKTAPDAVAIMLTGKELGIPPMVALRSIYMINGKPTMDASLMASLIRRAIDEHGDGRFFIKTSTNERCEIVYRRWNEEEEHTVAFSIQDAERAGLVTKNPNYKLYPADMLRSRCIGRMAKEGFQDVIHGMMTREEMSEEQNARPQASVHVVAESDANALTTSPNVALETGTVRWDEVTGEQIIDAPAKTWDDIAGDPGITEAQAERIRALYATIRPDKMVAMQLMKDGTGRAFARSDGWPLLEALSYQEAASLEAKLVAEIEVRKGMEVVA